MISIPFNINNSLRLLQQFYCKLVVDFFDSLPLIHSFGGALRLQIYHTRD